MICTYKGFKKCLPQNVGCSFNHYSIIGIIIFRLGRGRITSRKVAFGNNGVNALKKLGTEGFGET